MDWRTIWRFAGKTFVQAFVSVTSIYVVGVLGQAMAGEFTTLEFLHALWNAPLYEAGAVAGIAALMSAAWNRLLHFAPPN